MDFTLYYNRVKYPDRPYKPQLEGKYTAAELRAHADALDKYEAEMVVYHKEMDEYRKGEAEVDEAAKQAMLKDVGLQFHSKKDEIYAYCWEQGHSSGYSEVYTHLVGIAPLFNEVVLDHKERHEMLHKYLVELVADFNNKLPLDAKTATVAQLLVWSKEQTENPTEFRKV